MFKNYIYIVVIILFLFNILLGIKYSNSQKIINELAGVTEVKNMKKGNDENSFINHIGNGIDNSIKVISENISAFNVNKDSLLLNERNLLFYFNNTSCGTCIDEAIVEIGDKLKGNLNKVILLTSYIDEQDYLYLKEKTDYKYPVVKVNAKIIPFLSPTLLVVNKNGVILNAHTYIKEFPISNKLFLMSTNKILSN